MRRYDWDPEMERIDVRKHGVWFDEALSVLDREASRTVVDERHSELQDRFVTVGWSDRGRLLVVVTSEGSPHPRVISTARRAAKREQRHDFARRR